MGKRKNPNGRIAALLALTLFMSLLLSSFCVFSGSTRAEETDTREIVSDDASILTQEMLEMLRARAEQSQTEAVQALYASLMAAETKAEAEALMADMSEDEWNAFTAALTDEEYDALMQHLSAFEERTIRPAESYVSVGPLLDAVMVYAPAARTARLMSVSADENGLILSKNAEKTDDGYKIALEAYTTGDVTTQETTTPVDVYLVLDQSGSMRNSFSGSTNRQEALKSSVKAFINSVAAKYNENGSDHRIGIITYTDEGTRRSKLRKVDTDGKNSLISIVNDLTAGGDTRQGKGLELVNFEAYESGSGVTTGERKKVVILFMDGVPAESGTDDFNVGWGNEAVAAAKNLKDAGATVYTIGIFGGAKQDELYGAKFGGRYGSRPNRYYAEIACTGEVGSLWGGYYRSGNNNWNRYSQADMDMAAANRMMNYISSNFPGATGLGLEFGTQSFTSGGNTYSGSGYKITYNASRSKSGYYLTAANAGDLNTIFDKISQQIETPTIELGTDTEIRDLVTPYFDLPANAADIKVYTQAYNGSDFAGERADITGDVTVVRDPSTNGVSVTNFDFNANFVTTEAKSDGTFGKKLILEFTVTPKDGFLGGNGVPTNGDTSGVYLNNAAIETFEVPVVDVPIPEIVVSVPEKNVYLLNSLSLNDLKSGATISVGGVNQGNYSTWLEGLEDWQKAYVSISDSLTHGASGVPVPDTGLSNLVEDDTYAFGCTIAPKTAGTSAAQTGSDSANIYVFKPQITADDKVCNYNETVMLAGQVGSTIAWTHPGKENLDPAGAPSLLLTYYPGRGTTSAATHSVVTETEVDIKAAIGSVDVTGYTTFVRNGCTFSGCDNPAQTSHEGSADACEFVLHLGAGSLKITKSGGADGQTYIFNVVGGGKTFRVAVVGNSSVTIANLPLGVTYTVTEDEGWSWRYTASPENVLLDAAQEEVTIGNARDKKQWLDDEDAEWNNFAS